MTDIVERLREQIRTDHARGCQGRQYTCDCGYDLKTEGLLELAANEIERLQAEWTISAGTIRYLRAEIERLQTANEYAFAPTGELAKLRAASAGLGAAIQGALVAMRLASTLPGVAEEYDFEPAIKSAERALLLAGLKGRSTLQPG
jgi:hypothetical protein